MVRGGLLALVACGCSGSQDNRPWPPSAYAHVDLACLNRERDKLPAGQQLESVPTQTASEATPQMPLEYVPPNAIAGKRISGRSAIAPDEETRRALRRFAIKRACPSFKLCLDTNGVPNNVEVVCESCFPRYDADIQRVMYEWRYSPFTIDGVAVKVCTSVTLCYRQR